MTPKPTRPSPVSPVKKGPPEKTGAFAEGTAVIHDLSGPMGIRVLVLSRTARSPVDLLGRAMVVPLGSSVVELAVAGRTVTLDKASWMAIPEGAGFSLVSKSPTSQTLVLFPKAELCARVVSLYPNEIPPALFERILAAPHLLRRTTWVHELAHRYLFERAVCHRRNNEATNFLEAELVKELYFLCHEGEERRHRALLVEGRGDLVTRAIALLEEHLFEADGVGRLPKRCGASASTLLRAFRKEVGVSPLAYVRARRLDEALLLLKSGRYAVGEVATMVGYANLAAFSLAFRERFHYPPSQIRREGNPFAPTRASQAKGPRRRLSER